MKAFGTAKKKKKKNLFNHTEPFRIGQKKCYYFTSQLVRLSLKPWSGKIHKTQKAVSRQERKCSRLKK